MKELHNKELLHHASDEVKSFVHHFCADTLEHESRCGAYSCPNMDHQLGFNALVRNITKELSLHFSYEEE
jgi:hypothetical protein